MLVSGAGAWGDLVVVKPGPSSNRLDGVVREGRSAVDVSPLTGESVPVDKGTGDEVLAGSLNQFGALTVECRRLAEHTVVGRVIELTARALQDKAPSERTAADRLARWFCRWSLDWRRLTFLKRARLARRGLVSAKRRASIRTVGGGARLSVYPAPVSACSGLSVRPGDSGNAGGGDCRAGPAGRYRGAHQKRCCTGTAGRRDRHRV